MPGPGAGRWGSSAGKRTTIALVPWLIVGAGALLAYLGRRSAPHVVAPAEGR